MVLAASTARLPVGTLFSALAGLVLLSIVGQAQTPPAAPPPLPDPASARQRLKQLGPDEYEIGGIRFNSRSREIRIPTVVNLKQAPIEYMLVHETGKTHESVLRTAVNATDLQVALLLCHFEPGTEGLAHPDAPKDLQPIKPVPLKTPGTNRLVATVEWKEAGQVHRAPLSEWFQNSDTRKPPPDLDAWIFSGSYVDERGFVAQADGSFIAVYLDRNAMINSPAKGNWDDQIWISLPKNIPEEGTEVTLILAPAPPRAIKTPTK